MDTAIEKFLISNGNDICRWDRGTVVIESLYAKQFENLGGNLNLFVAMFEDNGNSQDATDEYLKYQRMAEFFYSIREKND